MYKTGEVPRKGYADPKNVEWMYAQEYINMITELKGKNKKAAKIQFVDDGVASDDCI